MGIGLMAVVDENQATDICHHFNAVGEQAFIIGEIVQKDPNGTVDVDLID
jgi:phosphoribosylaminoimidazole (AIR) synthetase